MLTTADPYKTSRLAKLVVYHTFDTIPLDVTVRGVRQLNEHLHVHTPTLVAYSLTEF